MAQRILHAVTFLAPNMLPVYRFMIQHLSSKLGCEIELSVGSDYSKVFQADLAFICGLPYILHTSPRIEPSPIEAFVAPVLQGEGFQNRPIYFSDVIVHRDSPFHSFTDLRGCSWAYNEPQSQSGYGITRYWLAKLGETNGYFGKVVEAGFHQEAIRKDCNRDVDASAIDVQVLAVEMRQHPKALKQDIRAIFADIHLDPAGRAFLDTGFIDHFVTVSDADYDDIRAMLVFCEQADFLSLR